MFTDYWFDALSSFQHLGSTVSQDPDKKRQNKEKNSSQTQSILCFNKIWISRLVRQSSKFRPLIGRSETKLPRITDSICVNEIWQYRKNRELCAMYDDIRIIKEDIKDVSIYKD